MKRNIIAIGLVFAVLMSFASCKKLPQDSEFVYESQVYVVDDEGVTHELKTEPAGNNNGGNNGDKDVVYYYEDSNGNKVTVKHEDVIVATTKVRKTTTQAPVSGEQALTPEEESFLNAFNNPDALENLADESLTQPELEISDELIPEDDFEEIKVEVDNNGNPKHEEVEKRFTDIIEGGKFTFSMVIKSTDAEGVETIVPMSVVRDGKKMYYETAAPVSGQASMKMAMLLRDNNCYFIIPSMRAYMKMPVEDMDQIFSADVSDVIEPETNGAYISSNEVEINGKKYICDVYDSNGSTVKYYYSDKEIKRLESTDPDGTVTIIEFNEISDKANASKLKVPSGYFDMTNLMKQDYAAFSGMAATTKKQ